MGEDKIIIAPIFEKMHFETQPFHAVGTFQSNKGKGLLNYIFWLFIGIPTSKDIKRFEFEIDREKEVWKRKFDGEEFVTKTSIKGDEFIERRGVFEFVFLLKSIDKKLIYEFKRFTVFRIPIPKILSVRPKAICEEIGLNKWTFRVETKSPLGEKIVEYWGDAEAVPINKVK